MAETSHSVMAGYEDALAGQVEGNE